MGYDMHLVTAVECPDKEAADAEWDAALAARNLLERPDLSAYEKTEGFDPWRAETWPESGYRTAQMRVEAASEGLSKADLNYFRLNIWGMSTCREIMQRLGMVFEAERPRSVDWPKWDWDTSDHEPYDCEIERCEISSAVDGIVLACWQYRDLEDKVQRWTPLEGEGMLLEKFCSNDGWIVLPSEIKEALTIWSKHSEETRKAVIEETPWWPDWLAFLARASQGDGFRVH